MSKDDEVWQGYTPQGEPTSEPVTKPAAAKGALHGASHIWIWQRDGQSIKILLQRRGSDKRTWPGLLDISAAGHIDFGETPLQAAIRETREEIGYDLTPDDLQLLFVTHANSVAAGPEGIIENEFCWVSTYELKAESEFATDNDEVSEVMWCTLLDLKAMIAGKRPGFELVPHGEVYFKSLITEFEALAT